MFIEMLLTKEILIVIAANARFCSYEFEMRKKRFPLSSRFKYFMLRLSEKQFEDI